ncbi:histone deacetylation protein Rxt3-domain-containing protein [Lophiotrema nucula]|uniref:Histone deacetylation protein Rxt3-domain-containing protein n=1 Tax=Lophiotrema nucula TaxID=690887 RepID=A0A6A5ZAM7_9PLEO|nr:histone deacetylation protein Rxt3-domain-containing protein [Lophiotrema nucula]
MDPRQTQHPFTRPPERSLIHNPNHQPGPPPSQPSSFAGYPPASQPQQPVHIPFSADPYPSSRRDPFLPSGAHHARRSSYGLHGDAAITPAQGERAGGGWGNTGTNCGCGSLMLDLVLWCNCTRSLCVLLCSLARVPSRRQIAPTALLAIVTACQLPASGLCGRRSVCLQFLASVHSSPHRSSAKRAPPCRANTDGLSGPGAHGIHHASYHTPSGPPPPPSMSASHNGPGQSQYPYDASRRRSPDGRSPPNPYGAPSHDPPPPPPSFARPMPPPTSPQQQHNHASQAPRAPFPSTFGAGRELPGLGASHRPGSSMSISSLIGGGDSARPHTSSQAQSSPPSTSMHAPSTAHHMQPPSPRRNVSSEPRSDFPPLRRQPSPDRYPYASNASRISDAHGYPARSPPHPYSNQGSPEQPRPSIHQTSQPYKPMIFQNSRPYPPALIDQHARDPRQLPAGIPPRPNSQPSGPPEHELKSAYDGLGGRRTAYGPPEERRRTLEGSHHARPSAVELMGAPAQPTSERDRPVTVQPLSHSAFSPPRDARGIFGPVPAPRNLWRQSSLEEPPRESTEIRREEQPALYRGYGGYSSSSQTPLPYSKPASEDMVRGRSFDHLSQRVLEQYNAPPTSDPQSNDRQKAEQMSRSLSSGGRSFYPHLGPEANRRTGRASPLPQAVQGAQAQPLSGGKDPSIKSEFGRMFSGLGSGLGSSTPSRQSPMPQNGPEPPAPGSDLHELRLQRVNSQNGRKPKRVKDEDGFPDNESLDGRGTPSLRGTKRNKQNHSGHHHHHAHAHHHHHHHHNPNDEMVPSTTSTPFNQPRFSSVPQNGGSTQASHHHHHYHAAPHHHHHAPRAGQAALLSPKLAPKIHDIQAVLDEAAKHLRKHLGSYLYEATTQLPAPNSSLDDQFSYASKPKPLPRFEHNPINCTVTVRIPRYYLRPRQRQQIVLQRHLWGAKVYRDDSDPIAAAIHSGWIRGEWDDTVDVSMLDPRLTAPNDPSDAEDVLTKIPAAPVAPPADMELQMDLLVLPRVEKYAGTVEYGVSSRKSSNHDGLSFMIEKMRWVEEGFGSRGQERGAAAMKQRLDASTTLMNLRTGETTRYDLSTAL